MFKYFINNPTRIVFINNTRRIILPLHTGLIKIDPSKYISMFYPTYNNKKCPMYKNVTEQTYDFTGNVIVDIPMIFFKKLEIPDETRLCILWEDSELIKSIKIIKLVK